MNFIIAHKIKLIVGAVILLSLFLIFKPDGKNNDSLDSTATNVVYNPPSPLPGTILRETVPKVEPNKQVNFPTKWSYSNGVVADNLKIKNISKIDAGILVDANTGKILWSKKSQKPKKIASMTKMMTTLLAVQAIKNNQARLDQKIAVSKAAANVGGSQVYLDVRETFTLEELLKTIMIKSANDSSHLVAETIGDSYQAFIEDMNQEAKKIGMNNTVFYNPHGLPIDNKHNLSSALDMAILARELLKYPMVIEWSSTWVDWFRDHTMMLRNHNPLVNPQTGVEGVDGLKTGYYSSAGFSLTATALRDDRRLIAVVIGVKDKRIRQSFASDLIEWGYEKINANK